MLSETVADSVEADVTPDRLLDGWEDIEEGWREKGCINGAGWLR